MLMCSQDHLLEYLKSVLIFRISNIFFINVGVRVSLPCKPLVILRFVGLELMTSRKYTSQVRSLIFFFTRWWLQFFINKKYYFNLFLNNFFLKNNYYLIFKHLKNKHKPTRVSWVLIEKAISIWQDGILKYCCRSRHDGCHGPIPNHDWAQSSFQLYQRVTIARPTSETTFNLHGGLQAHFPISLVVPSLIYFVETNPLIKDQSLYIILINYGCSYQHHTMHLNLPLKKNLISINQIKRKTHLIITQNKRWKKSASLGPTESRTALHKWLWLPWMRG